MHEDTLDLHARLVELAHEYRHLQQEHERENRESSTRHALERKMDDTRGRFERLLEHWVHEPAIGQAWVSYLHRGGEIPAGQGATRPPVFKGVDEAGSRVEVRPSSDGGYDILVNGSIAVHESLPWQLDADTLEPVQIHEHNCREVWDAPLASLEAIADFLRTPRAEPPWPWAQALLEDGVIDYEFALTRRGARALARMKQAAPSEPARLAYGILVADAARARILVLRTLTGPEVPTPEPLVEVTQRLRPEQRARDSDVFADARPGLRRESRSGPQHGVNDRRDKHRQEDMRQFACEVSREAAQTFRAYGVSRVVVAASPGMLGALRSVKPRLAMNDAWTLAELDRDLTKLTPSALHDALADTGMLPPRGRRPPLQTAPGLPV